ncbi:PAS domain-containing sensor histidine kinase [Oceanibaculum pacificum]|uniref:histidine kinase n=1 Tax=Oceanibaculum pacificum TaxID=580166 RepID=A0A154WFE5_9PROT|nr:PAS domain-containing sensor histidine kinase [Oceanibaculum pacificum]KZD12244.1 hypothetical protein AUP43_17020 [Oceanibaculum pacificum]
MRQNFSLPDQLRIEAAAAGLLDGLPLPAWMADADGVIVYCNNACAQILGLTVPQTIGRTLWDLFPQAQADEYHQSNLVVLGSNCGQQGLERGLTLNDERRSFNVSKFPVTVTLADGTEQRYAGAIATDVTRLTSARDSALSESAAKDRFLANMSHELRTPLNAIIGFAEMIASGLFASRPGKHESYAGDIMAAGRHLLSLVNDILLVAQLGAGAVKLHLEHVPLAEVLQEAASILQPQAARGDIQVETAVLGATTALIDRRAFKQIILNLAGNAVRHAPAGSIVRLEVAGEGGAFRLRVIDQGSGIPVELREKVVKPFSQQTEPLRTAGGRTGLGLAIVSGLAQAHGGSLAIEDTPGGGATMIVTFPQAAVARLAQAG